MRLLCLGAPVPADKQVHDGSARRGFSGEADVGLIFQERYEEFVAAAEAVLEGQEGTSALRHNLAVACYKVGDFPRARAILKELTAGDAGARSHYVLGLVERDRGEHAKAIDALTQALALHSDFVPACISRGVCYFRLGRFREAASDFRRATALSPGAVAAHYNLAAASVSLEDWDAAKQALSVCLQLDPFQRDDYIALLCEIGRAQAYSELSAETHRIKNVIGVLGSQLQALAHEWGQRLPPECRRCLDRIAEDHELLYSTVAAHLAQMAVVPMELDLADPLELVDAALVAAEGSLSGIHVERDCRHDVGEIVCESFAIREAFLNIILNAAEAMKGTTDGWMSISVARSADSGVTVSFADNGRGISQADLPHVLEYGFTTKRLGSGMGLAQVKRTVDRHGGNVSIHSGDGAGAVVAVTLPESPPQELSISSLSVRSSLFEDPSTLISEETPPDSLLIQQEEPQEP